MGKKPHFLVDFGGMLAGDDRVTLIAEFRHRIGDRVIEAAVQGPKLINLERHVSLEGQVGDRLAQVAVIVDHLVNGEPQCEQLAAMLGRGDAHLGQSWSTAGRPRNFPAFHRLARLLYAQGSYQLIKKHRYTVLELWFRGIPPGPFSDLISTTFGKLFRIMRKEVVQHFDTSVGGAPPETITPALAGK